MTFIPFDTWEEAQEIIAGLSKEASDLIDDRQRKLMDGKEHWAFFIDGIQLNQENLAIVHIKSYEQVINGDYPEDAPLWFDDKHECSRGYLPSETWDGFYNRPGDEADLHDVHAARLMEITKETFDTMYAAQCSLHLLAKDPDIMRMFLQYIALYGHIS